MSVSTLITKILTPQWRNSTLRRHRLLDLLYNMVDRKLVVVIAPAGYGKTTLLVDFATDLEHPVCWYTIDETDRDPRVFLEHLILSIDYRFASLDFGKQTRQMLADVNDLGDGAPRVVGELVGEITENIPGWFVLVLDDFHLLGDAHEVHQIIERIIVYQQNQFLTIVASRASTDRKEFITLLARDEVNDINRDDMCFIAAEVRELLAQNYGLDVSLAEAESLASLVEGWITGILLIDPSKGNPRKRLAQARASGLPVYDFLAREIVARQEADVQEFLIVASTLRGMTADLCRDILHLDDGERILPLLEGRNLFVVHLEGDGGWYRYHNLLREYLQQRLKQEDADRWAELHHRAAKWFETNGRPQDAVHHYLDVGEPENAARVIEAVARDVFVAGQLETLMTWGAALPASIHERAPRLALFQSRAADLLGQWEESLALTELAERGYRAREDHYGLAYTLLQRCEVWQGQGRWQEALDLGQEILSLIEQTGALVDYEAYRILGRSCMLLGQLDEGEAHLRRALDHCKKQGSDYERASIQSALADCLWQRGNWTKAIAVQQETVVIRRKLGNPGLLSGALNDLGFYLYSTAKYDEALRLFRKGLELARQTGHRRNEALTLISLAELIRDLGAFKDAAAICQEGIAIADDLGDAFLSAYGRDALGWAYRCQGDYPAAQAAIESALERAEQQRSEYQAGRYGTSLGLVQVEAGRTEIGLVALERACQRLECIGARSELARARFFAAWALYQTGREEGLDVLDQVLETADLPNRDLLFVVEGRWVLPLLELADQRRQQRNQSDGGLGWLLSRARTFDRAAREVLERAAPLEIGIGEQMIARVAAEPPVRIYGFGKGRAERGGKEIHISVWGAAATRWMLFYMLISKKRTRGQIALVLWPELAAHKVKANFHTTQFRLDRALGQDTLCYEDGAYRIHPEFDYWFDAVEFTKLVMNPDKEPERRMEQLQRAVGLYTADFLEDCYDEWAVMHREMLREQYVTALDELVRRLMARRRYRQAIKVLIKGLEIDDLRELFYRHLIRAYAMSGQRDQAIAQFQRCFQIMADELDARPSQSTTDLYSRVLAGRPLD